jgi:multimeric flavodoxin WrbA
MEQTGTIPPGAGAGARTLLIVRHSRTGGTLQMAEAAREGALAEGSVGVRVKEASDCGPDDLLGAQGYIFACPENLASMSGLMKEFFDRSYYSVLGRIEGRPYAVLICAGSDGMGAARQMARICTGWRLRAIAEPVVVITQAQSPVEIFRPKVIEDGDLLRCRDLGATLGAGLGAGIF